MAFPWSLFSYKRHQNGQHNHQPLNFKSMLYLWNIPSLLLNELPNFSCLCLYSWKLVIEYVVAYYLDKKWYRAPLYSLLRSLFQCGAWWIAQPLHDPLYCTNAQLLHRTGNWFRGRAGIVSSAVIFNTFSKFHGIQASFMYIVFLITLS